LVENAPVQVHLPDMSRFLGRSGEKAFSFLCSRHGVTCNAPQEDDNGWDHIVEFPHVPDPHVPADLQKVLPATFVQTKSHESDGLEIKMKLSNALKLARSPNPCFVLLATDPANGDCVAWHVVHFWHDLMERALRRAREAARDGIGETEFHLHSFSFTMKAQDEVPEADLLPWMQRTIRGVGPDYAAAKRDLYDTIGFDGPRFVGTLQFGPLKSLDELIDHQLGLTESLPVTNFAMHDRRFGIDVPLPVQEFDRGLAKMRANPVDECDVRVRGPDGYEMVLRGEIMVASLPGLEPERTKVRFRTPILDIIWAKSGESSLTARVDTAWRRPPVELEQLCKLIGWGGQGPVDVQVNVRDHRLLGAEIRVGAMADQPAYAALAILVEPLVRVSRHLKSKVPVISIENVCEGNDLEVFHGFITGLGMEANAAVPPEDDLPVVDHAVGFGFIKVGDWLFGALASWRISTHERSGGRWSLKLDAPCFLENYAFEATDEDALELFRADYRRNALKPGALPMDNVLAAPA
jgi:hypothetical protein